MNKDENGHPTCDEEPTDDMLFAGAKAAIDQVYLKGNFWDRDYLEDYQKKDWLSAMRFGWKAMRAVQLAKEEDKNAN